MKLVVLAVLVVCCIIQATNANEKPNKTTDSDRNVAVDEVVVNSVLNIRPNKQQQQVRRVRELPLFRPKRQFPPGFGQSFNGFGSSQSQANANANSNHFGPYGFGASAANSQAQDFNSNSPLGSFGASSTGALTQSFDVNNGKQTGGFGGSFTQQYRLPDGRVIDVSAANGLTYGPDGKPARAGSSAINISQG